MMRQLRLGPEFGYKACRRCGKTKAGDEFPSRKDRKIYPLRVVTIAVCRSCERARHRRKAKCRDPKKRQEERRRAAAKKGKNYDPDDRYRNRHGSCPILRREIRSIRRLGKKIRYRNRMKRFALVRRLYSEHPETRSLSWSAACWRARYLYDATFKLSEINRAHRRKHERVAATLWLEDGTLDSATIHHLFSATSCPYCDVMMTSKDKTLDHIVPLSRGGLHSIRNVLVCCRRCNTQKAGKTPKAWLRHLPAERRGLVAQLWHNLGSSQSFHAGTAPVPNFSSVAV
jgi:5-methylcytosine-specific restriction endonuclease McrA